MDTPDVVTLDAEGRRIAAWRGRLAYNICHFNNCRCYYRRGRTFMVGEAADTEVASRLYSLLTREVNRLAARDCVGKGKTWSNNYRIGCVDTIRHKLGELDAVAESTLNAAVNRRESSAYNHVARHAGRMAATEISIGGGARLTSGAKGLKG